MSLGCDTHTLLVVTAAARSPFALFSAQPSFSRELSAVADLEEKKKQIGSQDRGSSPLRTGAHNSYFNCSMLFRTFFNPPTPPWSDGSYSERENLVLIIQDNSINLENPFGSNLGGSTLRFVSVFVFPCRAAHGPRSDWRESIYLR